MLLDVTGRGHNRRMWWDDQVNGNATAMLPARRDAATPITPGTTAGAVLPSAPVDQWQWWWRYSQISARRWLDGDMPPVVNIYGPVLEDGECGLLETEMTYSRHYGGDGRYTHHDFFVVGRPAVMAGALAVNAVLNHRRKVAARRDAQASWRDTQTARVWSTNYRLICESASHGLISFDYGCITEFYPDLDSWSLTLGFDGGCMPLRLTGPAAPAISLWVATAINSNTWMHDPRLVRLLD